MSQDPKRALILHQVWGKVDSVAGNVELEGSNQCVRACVRACVCVCEWEGGGGASSAQYHNMCNLGTTHIQGSLNTAPKLAKGKHDKFMHPMK